MRSDENALLRANVLVHMIETKITKEKVLRMSVEDVLDLTEDIVQLATGRLNPDSFTKKWIRN